MARATRQHKGGRWRNKNKGKSQGRGGEEDKGAAMTQSSQRTFKKRREKDIGVEENSG